MKTVTRRSSGGVIFADEGKVVLTSRLSFSGQLLWGLPKGHIDEGETSEQAALREATEETGLYVELVSKLPTIDYWFVQPASEEEPAHRVHKFVDWFVMQATGGDTSLHDSETEDVAILAPAEALQRASFPSERKVIEAALSSAGL